MDGYIMSLAGCVRVFFACVCYSGCMYRYDTHTRTHREQTLSAFPPQRAYLGGLMRERIYACVCVFIVSPEQRRELWLGFANIDGWHPHQHSPRSYLPQLHTKTSVSQICLICKFTISSSNKSSLHREDFPDYLAAQKHNNKLNATRFTKMTSRLHTRNISGVLKQI
jgi:hypothetical protein